MIVDKMIDVVRKHMSSARIHMEEDVRGEVFSDSIDGLSHV